MTGILVFSGTDKRGRRNMRKFDRSFDVAAEDPELVLDLETDTVPRWP